MNKIQKFPVQFEIEEQWMLDLFSDALRKREKEIVIKLAKITLWMDALERNDYSNISGEMLREMMRSKDSPIEIRLLNEWKA